MTQDEIIEIANKAGIVVTGEAIYTLCKLVAQHERDKLIDAAMKAAEKGIDTAIALEREACAKIAEIAEPYQTADLIRARSKE